MFKLFKRRPTEAAPKSIARGCLPTFVTDNAVILSKIAPSIRNTYEIRLTLFMAKSRQLALILAVPPNTVVDGDVHSLLEEHGGKIQTATLDDYSVYFGRIAPNGDEDGWVLGNSKSFQKLLDAIQSPMLRERLTIGTTICTDEVIQIENELKNEKLEMNNIDNEDFLSAFRALLANTRTQGGFVFIQ